MLYLNDIEIKPTIFPDNTSQIWKISEIPFQGENQSFTIIWDYEHEGEIMHLIQLITLVINKEPLASIALKIPYLPYARQDKDITNNSTFALQPFANIISILDIETVLTIDAHNPEAFGDFLSVYPRAYNLTNVKYINIIPNYAIQNAINLIDNDVTIAYPDEGATKRGYNFKADIVGHKVRNQETGYIEQYNIKGDPKDKAVLIVDDICDGGMTFILMAKELYKQGAREVHLYTSHAIYSKGVEPLLEAGIKRLFDQYGEIFGKEQGTLIR